MKIKQIILDTNVLYSGLYSSRGASYQIIKALEEEKVKITISTTLLFEYEDVLKRKKKDLNLSDTQIDIILDNLCSLANFQKIYFLWRPCLKDPKDDHVLELAVASKSKTIVTYNIKDFKKASKFGIDILTPKELLKEIL